jgi:hypothetical protein
LTKKLHKAKAKVKKKAQTSLGQKENRPGIFEKTNRICEEHVKKNVGPQIPDPGSKGSSLQNLFQKGMFVKFRFGIIKMVFIQHQPELFDARILEVCLFADSLLLAAEDQKMLT